MEGVQDIAPISSLRLSNESTAANKHALGIKGGTPDFDRFMDTIEIEHAQLIADELDIDVKSAFCTFASPIVRQSIDANLVAPFTPLVYDDFDLIATVLKAPTTTKVVPANVFGFEIGGLATVRNILGHCYVCIEQIVETTTNPYCSYELQLYGFYKTKSQSECIGILDDLDIFDLSFDINFANPSSYNGSVFSNQATYSDEGDSGVPLGFNFSNWDGSEELLIDVRISNNTQPPYSTSQSVDYGYYDPAATVKIPGRENIHHSQYEKTISVPAGNAANYNHLENIITDDQYSKDTPFYYFIVKVTTASGKVLFTEDFSDEYQIKAHAFTLLDNDALPQANFGTFTGTLASGETKTIPVDLSKLPSTPLRSVANVLLEQEDQDNPRIEIVGTSNVVFNQGEALTKTITVRNNGEQVENFTLTLEAVENCEVGNNGTANFVTTNEDVAIAMVNTTQNTSTNVRELPITLQRSGNNGEIEVVLEQAVSELTVGQDYVFIAEDGSESTELPVLYIPAGVNTVSIPFLRFLNEAVPEDITELFTIANASDRDEGATVLFDENQATAFTQLFYQRTLQSNTTEVNGADEVIITPTFDSQIGDNKDDQFIAKIHPSSEIAANESEVTLAINRTVNTAQLRGFTLPNEQRFQNSTLRYTLVKIGEVLQFSEATIYEVTVPANALVVDPNADFTATQNPTTPETWGFDDDSTQGTFPIASRAWDFGDGNTDTGEQVQHTYATPGTYQVTLTVTDSQGNTASETKSIEYVAPYVRNLTALDMAINPAEELILTTSFDNVDSGSIIQDQFKAKIHPSSEIAANESEVTLTFDRSSGTAALRSFTFPDERFESKTFRFTLEKIGNVLQFNEATIYEILIEANAVTPQPPVANFTVSQNQADYLEHNFDSSSSGDDIGITAYAWDFGDGNTSTEANPTHAYAEQTDRTVTLTVTDGDGLQHTKSLLVTPPAIELNKTNIETDPRPSNSNRYGQSAKVFSITIRATEGTMPRPTGALEVLKIGITGTNNLGGNVKPYYDRNLTIFPPYFSGSDYRITNPDGSPPVLQSSESQARSYAIDNPDTIVAWSEGEDWEFLVAKASDFTTPQVFFVEFDQPQLAEDCRYTLLSQGSNNNLFRRTGRFPTIVDTLQA
jgi:PKD repeat protein